MAVESCNKTGKGMYHYTQSGLRNIWLKNGYNQVELPEGLAVSIDNPDGLHRAIALALVNKAAPLSGDEFRFLRIELDLSQKALGHLMERTDQAVALWEKGVNPVPALADKAIRDLYMESIGGGAVAGLLQRLADVDRRECEYELQLEETDKGWRQAQMG